MRVIDADALNARIDKCVRESGIGLEPVMAIRDIKALISVMPTFEAVQIEPLCQWLAGYAAPPNYALEAVYEGYKIQPNLPIITVNYYVEAWKYHFRELLKSGLLDEGEKG